MSKKIGLLGGSFNPAHAGHLHISKQAIDILGLDEIWWLVSPQNPLKPKKGMAEFSERFLSAEEITENESKIIVSDFEKQHNTNKTYDTIAKLQKKHPEIKFIWLMGADNLVIFHKWYKWQEFFSMVPIAVFDRDDNKPQALSSPTAILFANNLVPKSQATNLINLPSPAWSFFDIKKHPASSTKIRKTL